jgi:hypothetical protein
MKAFPRPVFIMAFLALLPVFLSAQSVLFNNGPFVTHYSAGAGGADFSYLAAPLNNFGFGNQYSLGLRLADDFTVTGDTWHIDSIVFFEYQTGSSTISTFTGTNIMIWQGSTVVWGDNTTNRLQRSVWSNCYRGSDFSSTDRPIMRNCCVTPSLTLPVGKYYLDWQADGSLTSGPWNPPITISGQNITGDAKYYENGSWYVVYGDSTDYYAQGLPFIIYGRVGAYPSTITISQSYSFSDPHSLFSYKIIGLPGQTNFSLASVIPGTPNKNWTAFWDNGQSSDYMKVYDGSGTFTFTPGAAFWITSESAIAISKNVNAVPLDAYNGYTIKVHSGWCLISDPFEEDVSWSDIKTANSLSGNATLYDWNGYWNYATTLQAGKGYYVNNNTGGDFDLFIPYPGLKSVPARVNDEPATPGLTLALQDDTVKFGQVRFVFNENSESDFDEGDIMIPPGDFEVAGIRILAPQMTTSYKELYTESRQALGTGQSYQVQIKNNFEKPLQLTCSGFGFFPGQEVWLVNNRVNHYDDLKQNSIVEISTGTHCYTLVIGNRAYAEKQAGRIHSGENEIFNCYPNPFKNQATIGFSITSDCFVNIGIFDIPGKLVRQLVSQRLPAGYHEAVFDASAASPGIYFCKMEATSATGLTVYSKVIRLQVAR